MTQARIVSDGTPAGTIIYDAKGRKMAALITKATWSVVAGQPLAEVTLTLADVKLDVKGRIPEVKKR